jgi:Major Facilitator Superfamily
MIQLEQTAVRRKLPLPVKMFALVSLLNEVSAQMVAPLIPILLVSVLAAGPVAIGAVEGIADAAAAFLKLWSGRHADVRPQRRKAMVLLGYGLALASRPLIGLAGNWGAIIALRAADRLGKGLRGAPRDAILADAAPKDMQGRAYGLNRGMDYAGAVLGSLIAAGVLAWWGISIPQVIMLSTLPGVLVLLTQLDDDRTNQQRPQHKTCAASMVGAVASVERLSEGLGSILFR